VNQVGQNCRINAVRKLQQTALALLGSVAATSSLAACDIPVEARRVIAAVRHAAEGSDFGELEKLMAKEFVWGFGPDVDGSASQAIGFWREDPGRLAELARVTGLQCRLREGEYVQCPASAGISYRAGFRRTAQGWRMVYFVTGD
jgi:hypothetical protein